MTGSETVSATDIARSAEVKAAAVSNWRRRSVGFPGGEQVSGAERFLVTEVAAWLDKRKIARNALKPDEPAGTTYGQRFRRNRGEDGGIPPAQQGDPVRATWRSLHKHRGDWTATTLRDAVLGLLCLRVLDPAGWAHLVSAGDARLLDVLRETAERHRDLLPGLAELDSAEQARGLLTLLDEVSTSPDQSTGTSPAEELADLAMEQRGLADAEFHTPDSLVRLMVQLLEPLAQDRIHDPCCGTGSLLAGALRFRRSHRATASGPHATLSGRALADGSRRLARTNLALHGCDADLGPHAVHALREEPAPEAEVVLANPPFNMRSTAPYSADDPRWRYGVPPQGNANFAWLQHVLAALAPDGRAAVVMPNGASFTSGERDIRRRMVDDGVITAVLALPSRLFRGTGASVSVWILEKSSAPPADSVLFVDATRTGTMADRVQRILTSADSDLIASTCRQFRSGRRAPVPGFSRAVPIDELGEHDYRLDPRAYITDPATVLDTDEALRTARRRLDGESARSDRLARTDGEVAEHLARIDWATSANSEREWDQIPLEEVCGVLAGPSARLAEAVPGSDGVQVVTPKNLRNNRIIDDDVLTITPESARKRHRYQLADGDVVCVRTGDLGRQALVGPEQDGWLIGTACLRLRPDESRLTGRYLTYYLGSAFARDWIQRNSAGRTIPSLNAQALRTMPIAVPPLEVQEEIGEILAALDAKVASHEEISRTTGELRDSLAAVLGTRAFPLRR